MTHVQPKYYPWRNTDDPYQIFISEIMLHRTRASQVAPVYEKFIEEYPTIHNFVNEKEEVIEEKIKSLGLFWRIEGLIRAVHQLYASYGEIPVDYEKLTAIQGVGPYIAGAVVCFASNQPMTLIDTNTVRVIGRVFGLNLEGEARRRKEVRETLALTTPEENPKRYYYCIIDLAHDICHVRDPECERCPLKNICEYFESNKNRRLL